MKIKKIVPLVLLVTAMLAICAPSLRADAPQKETVVFTVVPALHCQNCENKIKTNLRFEKGVNEITTDIRGNKVTIVFDTRKTDKEKLKAAFKKIGYEATEVASE